MHPNKIPSKKTNSQQHSQLLFPIKAKVRSSATGGLSVQRPCTGQQSFVFAMNFHSYSRCFIFQSEALHCGGLRHLGPASIHYRWIICCLALFRPTVHHRWAHSLWLNRPDLRLNRCWAHLFSWVFCCNTIAFSRQTLVGQWCCFFHIYIHWPGWRRWLRFCLPWVFNWWAVIVIDPACRPALHRQPRGGWAFTHGLLDLFFDTWVKHLKVINHIAQHVGNHPGSAGPGCII